MSTPSDFQRLASVVRTTFPAAIAQPFYASTEPGGDDSLTRLLAALLRYLTLIHLRAYLGSDLVVSADRRSALFTAHRTGRGFIRAASGTLEQVRSDTITVMHQGKVLAEGKPAEIAANKEVQTAYLGGLYELNV